MSNTIGQQAPLLNASYLQDPVEEKKSGTTSPVTTGKDGGSSKVPFLGGSSIQQVSSQRHPAHGGYTLVDENMHPEPGSFLLHENVGDGPHDSMGNETGSTLTQPLLNENQQAVAVYTIERAQNRADIVLPGQRGVYKPPTITPRIISQK